MCVGCVCVDVHQGVCTGNGSGAVGLGVLYIWVPATGETKDPVDASVECLRSAAGGICTGYICILRRG